MKVINNISKDYEDYSLCLKSYNVFVNWVTDFVETNVKKKIIDKIEYIEIRNDIGKNPYNKVNNDKYIITLNIDFINIFFSKEKLSKYKELIRKNEKKLYHELMHIEVFEQKRCLILDECEDQSIRGMVKNITAEYLTYVKQLEKYNEDFGPPDLIFRMAKQDSIKLHELEVVYNYMYTMVKLLAMHRVHDYDFSALVSEKEKEKINWLHNLLMKIDMEENVESNISQITLFIEELCDYFKKCKTNSIFLKNKNFYYLNYKQ